MTLFVLAMAAAACGPEPAPVVDEQTARLVEELQARYARGDWSTALVLADSAAGAAPDVPVIPFTRGLILTKLRQYDDAEASYRRALEIDPSYRQGWYHLGHNAFLQRRYRDALAFYGKERALLEDIPVERRRSLPAITAQIGRTYDLLGVQDSARTSYEAALTLDSTYAVAHSWLSDHYEKAGRLEEALHHAELALENSPENVEYAYQVGSLLFQTGHASDAVPLLATVVQRWPGHEGASYNLGRAFMALGREEEGQMMLDRVEEIRRLQEEALVAQREVEMNPEDPARWTRLAGLMLRSGYLDKADEAFTAALARNPGDLSLQNDLANLALMRGDTTTAVLRFQSLLRQDSTFADAWLNLGIIYAMEGRTEHARAAWQRVLRYKPDDPDALAYLDRLN